MLLAHGKIPLLESLETVYAAFDAIAKQKKIFKVETVCPFADMVPFLDSCLGLPTYLTSFLFLSHSQIGDCCKHLYEKALSTFCF